MIKDTSIPVVIINCKLAALGIMRSLGSLGVPIYGVDANPSSAGMLSRYCKKRFYKDLDANKPEEFADYLIDIAKGIGRPPILIPTSDETAIFVAEYADALDKHYIFLKNDPELVKNLAGKNNMFHMAVQYNVPTPHTEFPEGIHDILSLCEKIKYPVMLKGIHGNRLLAKTGKKMVIVNSKEELIREYKCLEDHEMPNLMLQEFIPGDDDQIFIFNGYFNNDSDCSAAFTGYKVRQYPIHLGCASLGECRWNQTVADCTVRFMKEIGYKGILDIGYRYDARDGQYKVLDINPRIGQAFRLFLSENGMDVARVMYLDLTRQEPAPIIPREGRRWFIENFDVIASIHYAKEGSLRFIDWVKSFKNVEEAAWFSIKDPFPFLIMMRSLIKRAIDWFGKKLRLIISSRTKHYDKSET